LLRPYSVVRTGTTRALLGLTLLAPQIARLCRRCRPQRGFLNRGRLNTRSLSALAARPIARQNHGLYLRISWTVFKGGKGCSWRSLKLVRKHKAAPGGQPQTDELLSFPRAASAPPPYETTTFASIQKAGGVSHAAEGNYDVLRVSRRWNEDHLRRRREKERKTDMYP